MASPRRWGSVAWTALVALACSGPDADRNAPPPEAVAAAEEISFETVADMAAELEVLDLEIAGLADYIAARPDWTPPDPADPDPRAVLDAARDTRAAAASALAAADTARAADSLRAAAARIEHVKRLLFVAEEMGIEFDPADGTVAPD